MNQSLLTGVALLGLCSLSHSSEPVTRLSPLTVAASTTQLPSFTPPDPGLTDAGRELSKTLPSLAGVTMRTQGGHCGEPILRGLGWERVDTQYNGLALYGSCPSRMDPPLHLFTLGQMESVAIELGPASVTHGPVPIGGRILLENHLEFSENDATETSVQIHGAASSAGDAVGGGIQGDLITPTTAFRIEGSIESSNDYESGDGTQVQANRDSEKSAAFWKQQLPGDLILELGTRWVYDKDIDYVALPMDGRYVKTNITTGQLHWTPDHERLNEVTWRAGYGEVEHLMDNRDKANRRRVRASTPSTAESMSTALHTRWNLANGELVSGIDASQLDRDALRTRTMVMMNRTFRDPIWPDLRQEQVGIFTEWTGALSDTIQIQAGVRADTFTQDAGKATMRIVPGPGVGPTTVQDAWVDVGGSEPGVVKTEDTPLSANLILQHTLQADWMIQAGLSRVEAVPNLTQRYLSFGPVPGGFGVGTPSLDPETKVEIEFRTEGRIGPHAVGVAVFAAHVQDYLLPTTITMLDVNGDGRKDRVRGTINEDAELYGAEASATLVLSEALTLPITLSFVRGEVSDSGEPLPEIPPMDVRAALRWQGGGARPWYAEAGIYAAARQDRVNSEFGEDETPSYALIHIKAGMDLTEHWKLEAGVENLFDREYHDHLSREALLPEGDLKAGDEVPGPGRGFQLAAKATW